MSLIPTYGNYGGPGYSAGMVGGTTPETPNPAPVDALDALFYQHDLVYQHYSDGVITDPALLAAADVQLVKSMYALTYTDPGGSNYDPWAGLYEGFATLGMVGKLAANGTLQHLSLSDQLIIASATNEAVVNLGAGLAQGPAIVAAETVYFEMNSVAPLGAHVPNLAQFANHQYNYGQQIGVIDPFVYMYEALGQALSESPNYLGETSFNNSWGPTAIVDDTTFVNLAYNDIFGVQPSAQQSQHFIAQLDYFESIYIASQAFGTDLNRIDLLARGAVFGQMVGIAEESSGNALAFSVFDWHHFIG